MSLKTLHIIPSIKSLDIIVIIRTCESEISVRIESRMEFVVVVYMFNADCHVRVVYLIMCKPTTVLQATLYVLFFFGLYCRSTCL